MPRQVEQYLLDKIKRDGAIHLTLLDPDKTSGYDCAEIAREAALGGTAGIMVGGSTLASNSDLDDAVQRIKKEVDVPVILFPNNLVGVSQHADAIWFMSLLNSSNPYYIIDCQALSAPVIRCYGLEAIPLGYIIIGEGGTVGYVGQARKIPYNTPELALGYSLAGEMLGMRFIYLEAGSGAKEPIPPKMIGAVKKHLSVPLVVGGGIRNPESARAAAAAGADIIVTGNMVEDESRVRESIEEIVQSIRK